MLPVRFFGSVATITNHRTFSIEIIFILGLLNRSEELGEAEVEVGEAEVVGEAVVVDSVFPRIREPPPPHGFGKSLIILY